MTLQLPNSAQRRKNEAAMPDPPVRQMSRAERQRRQRLEVPAAIRGLTDYSRIPLQPLVDFKKQPDLSACCMVDETSGNWKFKTRNTQGAFAPNTDFAFIIFTPPDEGEEHIRYFDMKKDLLKKQQDETGGAEVKPSGHTSMITDEEWRLFKQGRLKIRYGGQFHTDEHGNIWLYDNKTGHFKVWQNYGELVGTKWEIPGRFHGFAAHQQLLNLLKEQEIMELYDDDSYQSYTGIADEVQKGYDVVTDLVHDSYGNKPYLLHNPYGVLDYESQPQQLFDANNFDYYALTAVLLVAICAFSLLCCVVVPVTHFVAFYAGWKAQKSVKEENEPKFVPFDQEV